MMNRKSAIRIRHAQPSRASGAFSLVEVLLAIIILGVGVISIAALFPAGIAQQRLAGDDVMGPIVANHAVSIIRSKVSPEDFGSFEEFYNGPDTVPGAYFTRTIPGDWGWMRPSFLLEDVPATRFIEKGAIDIFSYWRVGQVLGWSGMNATDVASEYWDGWPDIGVSPAQRPLRGIPFNTERHWETEDFAGGQMPIPPQVIISQYERYYPMATSLAPEPGGIAQDPPMPQYVWDCMFRRHQGQVYVAVFVYRVSAAGGAAGQRFFVQPNQSNSQVPPSPIAIDMTPGGSPDWPSGPWDIQYENDRPLPEVPGFPFNEFDVLEERQSWQAPRQWILDQNMHVHRVLGNRRDGTQMIIELTRPLSPVRLANRPGLSANPYMNAKNTLGGLASDSPDEYHGDPTGGPNDPAMVFPNFDQGVVTRFWYIPSRMEDAATGAEFVLTPVYIAVKEL